LTVALSLNFTGSFGGFIANFTLQAYSVTLVGASSPTSTYSSDSQTGNIRGNLNRNPLLVQVQPATSVNTPLHIWLHHVVPASMHRDTWTRLTEASPSFLAPSSHSPSALALLGCRCRHRQPTLLLHCPPFDTPAHQLAQQQCRQQTVLTGHRCLISPGAGQWQSESPAVHKHRNRKTSKARRQLGHSCWCRLTNYRRQQTRRPTAGHDAQRCNKLLRR
jgi:hypothetical protein